MITRVSPLSLAVPKIVDTGVSKTVFWLLIATLSAIIFYLLYVLSKHQKSQKEFAIEQTAIKQNLADNAQKTNIAYEALEKVVATPEVTAILVKNNQLSANVFQSTSANNTQLLQPVIVGRG